MDPPVAVEKLIKLALRRHDEGMPALIIYFDQKGVEVSRQTVEAATPMEKFNGMDVYSPKPGVGYYAHIRLDKSGRDAATGDTYGFLIETPTSKATATYKQPFNAPGMFTAINVGQLDAPTSAFFGEIENKLP